MENSVYRFGMSLLKNTIYVNNFYIIFKFKYINKISIYLKYFSYTGALTPTEHTNLYMINYLIALVS